MNESETILLNQIKKDKTPSVQYIIFTLDNIIYEFRSGLADIKNLKKADHKTRLNAYSVTKTFTALGILKLEEKGLLKLSDFVKEYLTDFRYPHEITIKNLLTHTSGIPNPVPLKWIHLPDEHSSFNADLFFDSVFKKHSKVTGKPNEKYAYTNLGYVILGRLIEKISGQSYENYICSNIIEPCGISADDLSFEFGEYARHARGYNKKSGFSNIILSSFIDKSKFMGTPEGKWRPFNLNYVNGSSYGGLIGTPDSFVKYIRELLKPDSCLVTENIKAKLFMENFTKSGKATGMCLAWFKGHLGGYDYFAHAGGGGGYYCEIRIYPELHTGSVIMFNRTGMSDERFLDKLDIFFIGNKP